VPDDEIEGKPFSEFWMGDHINGPSKILIDENDVQQQEIFNDIEFLKEKNGQEISIKELFEKDATKFLGQQYLEVLGGRDATLKDSLAYLFKVLSVRTALSIQAHPNKELAQKLHAEFPDKYKDPNHKPEIAVALSDDFMACYGFSSAEKILHNLQANPVLAETFSLGEKEKPDEEYLQ
jgi:mannose-6-phosphate isomerase